MGTHRYAFLLFQQHHPEPVRPFRATHGRRADRKGFNTRQFAKEHDLGLPVAATWFLSHK